MSSATADYLDTLSLRRDVAPEELWGGEEDHAAPRLGKGTLPAFVEVSGDRASLTVEFVDDDGVTIGLATLTQRDVRVHAHAPSHEPRRGHGG